MHFTLILVRLWASPLDLQFIYPSYCYSFSKAYRSRQLSSFDWIPYHIRLEVTYSSFLRDWEHHYDVVSKNPHEYFIPLPRKVSHYSYFSTENRIDWSIISNQSWHVSCLQQTISLLSFFLQMTFRVDSCVDYGQQEKVLHADDQLHSNRCLPMVSLEDKSETSSWNVRRCCHEIFCTISFTSPETKRLEIINTLQINRCDLLLEDILPASNLCNEGSCNNTSARNLLNKRLVSKIPVMSLSHPFIHFP